MDLKQIILGSDLSKVVPFPTPELPDADGQYFLRRVSPAELSGFLIGISAKEDKVNLHARLAALCLCDLDGAAVLTPADAEKLGAKPGAGAFVKRIADAASDLNGIGGDADEDLRKNCEGTRASGSTSSSA